MTRVFVNGGMGFIGTNLVEHFKTKTDYAVCANSFIESLAYTDVRHFNEFFKKRKQVFEEYDVSEINRDLRVPPDEAFKKTMAVFSPTVVINLAAVNNPYVCKMAPHITMGCSLDTLQQLIKISPPKAHIIHFSSSMVYDNQDPDDFVKGKLVKEHEGKFRTTNTNWYAQTKIETENAARTIHKLGMLGDKTLTIVRPSAVFGPYDDGLRVVSLFTRNLINQTQLKVHKKMNLDSNIAGACFTDVKWLCEAITDLINWRTNLSADDSNRLDTFNICQEYQTFEHLANTLTVIAQEKGYMVGEHIQVEPSIIRPNLSIEHFNRVARGSNSAVAHCDFETKLRELFDYTEEEMRGWGD